MAADIDPQNADVYHHRGQLKILLDQVEEAVADFDECIRLRPESALAQAQKCFALVGSTFSCIFLNISVSHCEQKQVSHCLQNLLFFSFNL